MAAYEIVLPIVVVFAVLAVSLLVLQRRQLERFRGLSERVQKEKEAVIALMDNIGEKMTRRIDVDETLEVIAQFVVGATQAESAAIFLLNDADLTLAARVVVGQFPPLFDDHEIASAKDKYLEEKVRRHRIKVGEGIIGSMIGEERPLLIADAEADPRVPRSASRYFPLHSLVLCALRARGRDLGVIIIVNKQGEAVFDQRDTFLLQALADQAAITVDLVNLYDVLAKQQKLEQELEIAHDFQRMLLPRKVPQIPGYEFSATNQTALTVGGDFYDFFEIDQDHLGIVIGDVSGKGIPGALIMASVRSILRAEARDTLSPKLALRRINSRVLDDTKESVFVTITYGILDLTNRRFRFARAGHEPTLLHLGNGKQDVQSILPEGMAVGLMPSETFDLIEEAEVQLSPGDTTLLYTDGAIEALSVSSEEYGRDRLKKVFADNADRPAEELVQTLVTDIQQFAHGIPQHDDITLVAFRVLPRSEEGAGTASEEANSALERRATQTA